MFVVSSCWKHCAVFFLVVLAGSFSSVSAGIAGSSFEEEEWDFGVQAGIVFPGEISVSYLDEDLKKENTFLVRGYFDAYVVPKLAIGAYVQFGNLSFSNDPEYHHYGIPESGSAVGEVGMAIKPRFILSPTLAIKPGLSIGYRIIMGGSSDDSSSEYSDDVDGLAINGSCELQFRLWGRIAMSTEVGFLTQPVGGNEWTDVTFGPIFYLLGGVVF